MSGAASTREDDENSIAFAKVGTDVTEGLLPQSNITLADVGGVREAKKDLMEIVSYLRDPHIFTRLGMHHALLFFSIVLLFFRQHHYVYLSVL